MKMLDLKHESLKEANRKREQRRKQKIIGRFNWTESHFYFYSIQRGWIQEGRKTFLKMKYLNLLRDFLEENSGLKFTRTYRRYKKGILKFIDDHFFISNLY
jgi:hypothetical protein